MNYFFFENSNLSASSFLGSIFLVFQVAKFDHELLFGDASNWKDHYRSLELEFRASSNPKVGDLLVYHHFENKKLKSTDSVRLEKHQG